MCVIVVCESRKMTRDEVRRAFYANPHGVGMAWAIGGTNRMVKGFETRKAFEKFYRKHKFPFPHILHFRWASAGEIRPELTHPFICSADSPTVLRYKGQADLLFHNGTWMGYRDVLASLKKTGWEFNGPVSDSRVIAIMRHYKEEAAAVVSKLSNRFAILKPNGEVELHGPFYEKDGLRCSNLYWDRAIRIIKYVADKDQPLPGSYIVCSGTQRTLFKEEPKAEPKPVEISESTMDRLRSMQSPTTSWQVLHSRIRYGN